MHAQVVVHKSEVAILPGKVEGYIVRQFADPFDFRRIERRTIAISDRLRWFVSGILPAFEGCNELVEETALPSAQFADRGQGGGGDA